MAIVIRTIGSVSDATQTVASTTGSDPYVVTMGSPLSYVPAVGDYLTQGANIWVVSVAGSDTTFTVADEFAVGSAPANDPTATTVGRAHSTFSLAETDIATDTAPGDSLTWKCMNDGVLDDKVVINDATLGTDGSLTITSPVGERHTGTAGTGFVITPGTAGTVINVNITSSYSIVMSFLEITGWQGENQAIRVDRTGSENSDVFDSLILHDSLSVGGEDAIILTLNASRPVHARNCLGRPTGG